MAKGERFPAEWRTVVDPVTGVACRQLTDHLAHSHHLYFTNPGWYAGGDKLLFGSDRFNRTNLFGVDLGTGEITQLTDLEPATASSTRMAEQTSFLFASKNPVREEVYFWRGLDLVAHNLETLRTRTLYRAPTGFLPNITNVTADGTRVCTVIYADLSEEFGVDLLRGYVGFREYWQARPCSRIVVASVDGTGAETAFEENYWIGHVNTSPTQPHLLTYCHEGPWDLVDNRVWGLDLRDGSTWRIRPTAPGERVGHEYWFADGLHVGYHGRRADGTAFFGRVRHDGTDVVELDFPHGSTHFHSRDLDLVVGDGDRDDPRLLVWGRAGSTYDGPRVLFHHRGSFHIQAVHVHPRLDADGARVVFTTDSTGYGNVHLAEIPPLEELPSA